MSHDRKPGPSRFSRDDTGAVPVLLVMFTLLASVAVVVTRGIAGAAEPAAIPAATPDATPAATPIGTRDATPVATPAVTPTLAPISITATRSSIPIADPSAAVTEVGESEIRRSASRTLDDLLRRIPGFSLFRRLGSGAAHPTTQGVSLRGIGPSGTSRALVLVDGVPLNDPFGGWVHWDSIPNEMVERVEVLRGSGASLWGNYAMGGVINVITRPADHDGGSFLAEGGERGSGRTEGWMSHRFGATSVLAGGRWLRSGDYPLVRKDSRGPIDVAGGSDNGVGELHVEHQVSPDVRLRVMARGYHDLRDNGTPYTHNETKNGFFRTGLDIDTHSTGKVSADVFSTVQSFSSTFSAVDQTRSSELPASNQFDVPSTSAGGSVVWSNRLGPWLGMRDHHLVAGIDSLWVDGKSKELARFMDGAFTRRRAGGTSQGMGGVFVEDLIEVTEKLDVTAALRFDYWQSYDGFRREDALDTSTSLVDRKLGDQTETLVSPRLGLSYLVMEGLALRSAIYRGFRAPTINEQVRPFRVRNDVTEANESLDAEKLFGVEGGFDHQLGPWRSSATLFWNEVDGPIFNVTIGDGGGVVDPCGFVPAGGVCRQRRNLGSTHILGAEAETSIDFGHGLVASLAYLWSDGKVHSAPDDHSLVGNHLPQVPKHQGTIALDYDRKGPWRASLQVRIVGEQFDDDENTRVLGRFAAVDAFVARRIGYGFEVFAAAENLFDETIESGRTADGVVSIAAPRIISGGVRYEFGAESDAGGSGIVK
ncbi:MAG TPA: TonB-dependent receptor [Candidatus Limnocylindrales bacterium]|nr:TonB-dependent receptor [Candidatus Limnocylindrales bacterium]